MTTYELWFHELLGAYGVRLEAGQVTGVCGPLPFATVAFSDPSKLCYDERPEAIQRAQDSPEQLCMLEQWRKGEWPALATAGRPGLMDRARAWVRPRGTKKKAP
jgi:hypothetical protein